MVALQLMYDVLIEILLLLPVKSVFRFRAVSKVWNFWLSDPSFRAKFLQRLEPSSSPLLGFFEVCSGTYCELKAFGYVSRPAFLPTCEQGRRMPKAHRRLGFFMSTSNGLILCGFHPMKYYVCNPVTNRRFSLPPPPYNPFGNSTSSSTTKIIICAAFSHDVEDGSYMVVRAEGEFFKRQNTMHVVVYSSRTREWDREKLVVRAPRPFLLANFIPAIEIGGIIQWVVYDSIAVYDPRNAKDKLWLIQFPESNGLEYGLEFTYPCCGALPDGRFQCAFDDKASIHIYVLKETIHSYSYSKVVGVEEWDKKWILSYSVAGFGAFIDPIEIFFGLVGFHPQNPNIIYKRYGTEVYQFQFDIEKFTIQRVSFSWNSPPMLFPILLPYVHPIWPPSPSPPLPSPLP